MGSKRDRVKRTIRKTVKWGGAGLTVLLLVVWIGSGWYGVVCPAGKRRTILLHGGELSVNNTEFGSQNLPNEWMGHRNERFLFDTRFRWFKGPLVGYAMIPLWLPALLSLLATAAAWRADAKYLRRAREGACAACGYDRAGLAAGAVCPECGAGGGVVKAPA